MAVRREGTFARWDAGGHLDDHVSLSVGRAKRRSLPDVGRRFCDLADQGEERRADLTDALCFLRTQGNNERPVGVALSRYQGKIRLRPGARLPQVGEEVDLRLFRDPVR